MKEDAYEEFKRDRPDLVLEEIVYRGEFYTVARIVTRPVSFSAEAIVSEGISRRSGGEHPDRPGAVGGDIAMGRARKSMALKLESRRRWVKIHNDMMA